MRAWEVDPSALVIRALGRTGLAWDVRRISRDRQEQRYGSAS
jgi:stearoyl-CoA desaturase (Delta-9 desaturase)